MSRKATMRNFRTEESETTKSAIDEQQRNRGWAVAQSPMLKTTLTVARLKQRGYISMIDYFSKFKTSIW